MNVYFDLENVGAFIEHKDHKLYGDCLKTMQRQLDVFFNFKKEELAKNETLMAWFKFFTSGVGEHNKQAFLEEKFPERPLKSNTYSSFDRTQLSSMYLIHDEKIKVLKDMGAVLVGSPGEEIDVFYQLFLLNNDYKFDKKMRIAGAEFSCWDDIGKFSTATSDLLFFDPYILSIPDLIEINLIPLILNIICKARCKVNIVFYVDQEHLKISYDDLSRIVRKAVKSVTGKGPNITVIRYYKQRGVDSVDEHDRTIFTNYCRYYSGDTFNYFNPDGSKLTSGREIQITSMAANENHQLSLELISDIQANIDSLPKELIEGDKKSNFLNFK